MSTTTEIIEETAQQPVIDSFEAYEAAKTSKDAAPVVEDEKPAAEPEKPIETSEKPETADGSKQEGKPKRDRTAEGRIAELTARQKQLEAELNEWKAKGSQPAAPTQAEKKPESATGRPLLKDFVAALKADETYEDAQERHADALHTWRQEQAAKEREAEKMAQRTQETQTKVKAKVDAAMSKFEDFGDLMTAPIPATMIPAIQEFMEEFDTLDALHAVLSDPAELQRISQLSKARQLVELGKIDDRLSKPEPKHQPAPVSKAPAPIRNIGGSASESSDNILEAKSLEEYERMRNKSKK